MHPEFDLIVLIGFESISYRTVKNNIDCGKFAKLFNGGGHPKAAGSEINLDKRMNYIKQIFNLENKKILNIFN
jgi:oligoribonuclease NrnB/cAMP/cGMP phosphodiesterase (DHH superfamily)